jgi:hypothetical protein
MEDFQMTLDEILRAAQEGRFDDLPVVLDIPDAGAIADMGRGPSYAAAASGYMPTVKVGPKRRKVPLRKWVAQLRGDAA